MIDKYVALRDTDNNIKILVVIDPVGVMPDGSHEYGIRWEEQGLARRFRYVTRTELRYDDAVKAAEALREYIMEAMPLEEIEHNLKQLFSRMEYDTKQARERGY